MRPMVPLVVMLVAPALFAQEKSVEQGVYTGGQAARGTRLFESNCASCHREPGGNAPVLSGERFTKTFSDATLQTVFTPIKTTPRQAPGSLSDAEYVDIVTHLPKIPATMPRPNSTRRRSGHARSVCSRCTGLQAGGATRKWSRKAFLPGLVTKSG